MKVSLLFFGMGRDVKEYCHSYFFWKNGKLRSGTFEIINDEICNLTKDYPCSNEIYEEEKTSPNYTEIVVEIDNITKSDIAKAIPELFL